MKAYVFLVHNPKGYTCEVFFSKGSLWGRVSEFVRTDAELRRIDLGDQLDRCNEDAMALANAYGKAISREPNAVKMTVLEAEVGDPESFGKE